MEPFLELVLCSAYQAGGRAVGVVLDCLGVVHAICAHRGLPAPDGFPSMAAMLREGRVRAASGFPPGWQQIGTSERWEDLDVLVYHGAAAPEPWCAVLDRGLVWTAHRDRGVYSVPSHRWPTRGITELWRFHASPGQAIPSVG